MHRRGVLIVFTAATAVLLYLDHLRAVSPAGGGLPVDAWWLGNTAPPLPQRHARALLEEEEADDTPPAPPVTLPPPPPPSLPPPPHTNPPREVATPATTDIDTPTPPRRPGTRRGSNTSSSKPTPSQPLPTPARRPAKRGSGSSNSNSTSAPPLQRLEELARRRAGLFLGGAPPKHLLPALGVGPRRGGAAAAAAQPLRRLASTVLLTSAPPRGGPREALFANWRCHVEGLGLDYVALAQDPEAHAELESLRDGRGVQGMRSVLFPPSEFPAEGCVVFPSIAHLVRRGFNVLYASLDHVMWRVPEGLFAGIAAGRYDLLLHADRPDCTSRTRCPLHWKSGRWASAGLHFWSSRGGERTARLAASMAGLCEREPRTRGCCDPQQAVNRAVFDVLQAVPGGGVAAARNLILRREKQLGVPRTPPPAGPSFRGAAFCASERRGGEEEKEEGGGDGVGMLQYCIVDPVQHPSARHTVDEERYMAFHTSFIAQDQNKQGRLKGLGLWALESDGSCGTDATASTVGVGGGGKSDED